MECVIRTQRLDLRPFRPEDAMFIFNLMNQVSWIRYIGDRKIHSEDIARKYLEQNQIRLYNENGYGMYAMCLKGTDEVIGSCGIVVREGLETPDLGYAILEKYSGKAYTKEACKGVLEYAKNTLKFRKISAITTKDHQVSIRILMGLGFSYLKTIRLPNDPEELNYYELKFF